MDSRYQRDRLFVGIDTGKNACCLDDAGQALIEQARAALTAALALYRDMDMTFWLPQTEAALARVEG